MNFEQLLQSLAVEEYFDLKEALDSGGCTLFFEQRIEVTFEHHDNQIYLFSPVMSIEQSLSKSFYASLLQIHLFGLATHQCLFGYDAEGQRILLFCTLDLDTCTTEQAIANIEDLVEQVEHCQQVLPPLAYSLQQASASSK